MINLPHQEYFLRNCSGCQDLLNSVVYKHRVFIFSCEWDKELHVHEGMVSFLEKELSLWGEFYQTGILLSAAVMHLIV